MNVRLVWCISGFVAAAAVAVGGGQTTGPRLPARQDESIITGGTAVAAHGSSEMPVWGSIFHALDPSNVRVTARIRSLVAHIQSIQQK